jgi:hypothetical protein
MHRPPCERRVAQVYNGLGDYFCRACVGNRHMRASASAPMASNATRAGQVLRFKRLGAALKIVSGAPEANASSNLSRGVQARGHAIAGRAVQSDAEQVSNRPFRQTARHPQAFANFFFGPDGVEEERAPQRRRPQTAPTRQSLPRPSDGSFWTQVGAGSAPTSVASGRTGVRPVARIPRQARVRSTIAVAYLGEAFPSLRR